MRGMGMPRFSMLRALIATTLVALGFAVVPIAMSQEPGSIPRPAGYAIAVAFFALPMTGFGVIFDRPMLFGVMGAVGGILILYFRL